MSEKSLPALGGKAFEDLKLTNTHDAEYWSARDLQPLLGYSQWRRFEQAIERAKTSCKESGNSPEHHFAGAGKPITGGKGAVQLVDDYHLSRFACYLIAQNGDPRKLKKPQSAFIQVCRIHPLPGLRVRSPYFTRKRNIQNCPYRTESYCIIT